MPSPNLLGQLVCLPLRFNGLILGALFWNNQKLRLGTWSYERVNW